MCSCDLPAAERIRGAKSALKCKKVQKSINVSDSWHQKSQKVLEEIIFEKVIQIPEMKKLILSTSDKTYAHSF